MARKTLDDSYVRGYDAYVRGYGSGDSMKRVGSVDLDTGELLEGAVVGMFFPKRQNGFGKGWVAMSQNAMMELARADLGAQDMRVLFAVLAKLDFENYLLLSIADLAKEIDMQRPNVSSSITKLESLGVLTRGPKAGRSSTFRLNPSFGWKGSASNHQKALRDRMKAAGLSVVKSEPLRDSRTVDAFTGKADCEGGQ